MTLIGTITSRGRSNKKGSVPPEFYSLKALDSPTETIPGEKDDGNSQKTPLPRIPRTAASKPSKVHARELTLSIASLKLKNKSIPPDVGPCEGNKFKMTMDWANESGMESLFHPKIEWDTVRVMLKRLNVGGGITQCTKFPFSTLSTGTPFNRQFHPDILAFAEIVT
jgi:hypothetical protein